MSTRVTSEILRPAGERPAPGAGRFRGAAVRSEGTPLEPREAGAILDLAIEGLLARLGPSLAFALALWLPFRQVAELLGLSGLEGLKADVYTLAWNALAIVPTAITASVVASLVGDALVDRRASLAAGFARGLARAGGVVVILLLTQIATLPLLFLCLAPYFLVLWVTYAAVPIYVLEGDALLTPAERARASHSLVAYLAGFPLRIVRALRRSVALTRGAPALGRWLLLAVIGQLVLGGVLELGAMGLTHPEAREVLRSQFGFSGAAAEFALGAVAALFLALSSCLRAAMMVAYYLDQRVRREGWDLSLALERSAPEAGARA